MKQKLKKWGRGAFFYCYDIIFGISFKPYCSCWIVFLAHDRLLIKILFINDIAILLLIQQARSRDLPSYTSSSLPPLTDGDGGGRDSLTSATSTIIHEKCCSRMAWRATEKHFCGKNYFVCMIRIWSVTILNNYLCINKCKNATKPKQITYIRL